MEKETNNSVENKSVEYVFRSYKIGPRIFGDIFGIKIKNNHVPKF